MSYSSHVRAQDKSQSFGKFPKLFRTCAAHGDAGRERQLWKSSGTKKFGRHPLKRSLARKKDVYGDTFHILSFRDLDIQLCELQPICVT